MKYNLLCFAIGVLFGIFIGCTYCTAAFGFNQQSLPVPSTKELKKEVVQIETGYAKSFDTLKKKSERLASELIVTKSELQKAKQRSGLLQGQVYSLLDSHFERQQSEKVFLSTPCDTLAATVEDLMQVTAQKDTLYEQTTANLEEQIKTKDTTIALKDAQYTHLKTVFDKSTESQQVLERRYKQLSKQYKKQKAKGKFRLRYYLPYPAQPPPISFTIKCFPYHERKNHCIHCYASYFVACLLVLQRSRKG